jgi:hypothetical protein
VAVEQDKGLGVRFYHACPTRAGSTAKDGGFNGPRCWHGADVDQGAGMVLMSLFCLFDFLLAFSRAERERERERICDETVKKSIDCQ